MEPIGDPGEPDDFAEEHDATTVDPDVATGSGDEETESPDGWAGLEREGPP